MADCNCDQAIRNAKIAELALCALQGIRAVLAADDFGEYDSGMALRQIATLVSLAEAGVERLNRS